MVSGINLTSKTHLSNGSSADRKNISNAEPSAILVDKTSVSRFAEQLEQVPQDKRREALIQLLVTDVLENKLGFSGVGEPEYVRLTESITASLKSSDDAVARIDDALRELRLKS